MQLLKRIVVSVVVISILLLALVMGGVRLAISNIDYFKPEIEYLLARDAGPEIVFTGISGAMNRFNPILGIENVSITLPDRSQPLFVDRLSVEFDFWESLRERAPVIREISGQLEKVEILKDENGNWWSNEIALSGSGDDMVMPRFQQVLALVPRYLRLNLNRLVVRDLASDSTHQLERVSAQIDHRGERFFMQLSAALPDRLGTGVLIKSVLGPERSLVYVNSSNLDLAAVASLFDLDTLGLKGGALDGEVWINMSQFRLLAINGDLVLKKGLIQVAEDKVPVTVSYRSRFNAIARTGGWRINNQFERLQIDDEYVPGFRSQLEIVEAEAGTRLLAWIDRVPLSSLPSLAGQWLPAGLNRQIAQGRLRGLLHDVFLSLDIEKPEELVLSGGVTGFNSDRIGDLPGVENLDLEFVGGHNRFGLQARGKQLRLDFGDQFDAPLEFDEVALDANLTRRADSLLLVVNEAQLRNQDIAARGRMWLEADPDQRPFMYLRASFNDGNGASTSKYLPRKIMPAKTQAWLDRAIKDGFVPSGDLLFYGRLMDIRELARQRTGEFYVDFRVEDALIDFSPGWEPARNGAGRVLFHNAGMRFDMEQVGYDRVEQALARGGIENFDAARLEIEIDASLDTLPALDTWRETPVGKQYRPVLAKLDRIGGKLQSRIELGIPLRQEDDDLKVRVLLDFENATARAEDWGVELSEVNGRLEVTEDSIASKRLSARFFGDPVRLEVKNDGAGASTLISAAGRLESANLLKRLPASVAERVKGKSDWQVRIDLAGGNGDARRPFLRISGASRLKNTALELPQPFTSAAEDSARFSVELDFFDERVDFNASLGDDVRARGRLGATAEKDFELDALDLAIAGPLPQKAGRGVNVYGSIAEVVVDDWVELLSDTGATGHGLLGTVRLEIGRAHAYGRVIDDVAVDVKRLDTGWQGTVASSLVRGSFQAPLEPSPQNPVIAELEYLRIDKLEQKTDYSALRPSDVRDFRLRSKSVTYHDMQFEDLVVEASVDENLVRVDRLDMRLDQVRLSSSASWRYNPLDDSHVSSLQTSVRGQEFGAAIAGIGFGDTMRGGQVEIDGEFSWPAPLLGFDVGNVSGDAKIRVEDGVLNNVEPGSGRFVGLLSLSALPRRLSLDFSDVLIKGMEFDEITSRIRLENGQIRTKNTRMDGPAAKIKISGTTGLIERDYDQVMSVTPKIRQTLPLIGAVSAGATVGWGLLLLQNLFKKTIDDAVEVEYRITGSWDDPQIELIKAVDENQQEVPDILPTDR